MPQSINESRLIENEVRLRNLRVTKETLETRRSMVRWLALSLGVINPGESRHGALAVLYAILHFHLSAGSKEPTVEDMAGYIGEAWGPMNEKTLRYHLLQLKKAGLVENAKGRYFLAGRQQHGLSDAPTQLTAHLSGEIDGIISNIGKVLKELENR